VEKHESSVVNRYLFRFKPYSWAIFYIDHEWGGMTINSDWGSWSYNWAGGPTAWGRDTFLEFLQERSSSEYLADKLSYGRTREVPDGPATFASMSERIKELQRDGMNSATAHDALADVMRYSEVLDDAGIDAAYHTDEAQALGEYFDSLHEWTEMKTAPKVVFLIEQMMPMFVGYLRGEVKPSE